LECHLGCYGCEDFSEFLVSGFLDQRLCGRHWLLQFAEDLKLMLRLYDLEDAKDLPELSLHRGKLYIHKRPVDRCHAASRFGPCLQGDLVAVALDPLPYREFSPLDAQRSLAEHIVPESAVASGIVRNQMGRWNYGGMT